MPRFKRFEQRSNPLYYCARCGDYIPWPLPAVEGEQAICRACTDFPVPLYGGVADPHVDDDRSGYSGSWDNMMKQIEGNYYSQFILV